MSRLEIILSSVLFISLVLNVGIIAYARAAIVRLLWVSDELGDLQQMINSFSNHLQSVYEMDMFYGDDTLGALVLHARSLDEQLETFEFVYSLTEKQEETGTDDGESEESAEAETQAS